MDASTVNDEAASPIADVVARLPTKPGVYLHKDATGAIIYVGKAKNLRARVRSYTQLNRPADAKTKAMMARIASVDVIVTDTEAEALILENTLIKEHRPRYNVLLKDDKSYPFICITKEEFPQVFKTRRVVRDGSKYFGPYTDGTYLYYLLKTLRSVFPLRSCQLPLSEEGIAAGRWKVCLDYHIKKCDGPCEGHISKEAYNEYIRQAQQILSGKTRDLERQLEQRMQLLAEELRFEDALVLRHRLERLREYSAKQKVLADSDADRDVFALARIGAQACVVVFIIREGKLIGKRHYTLSTTIGGTADILTDADILRSTVERWYVDAESAPDEILVGVDVEDPESIEDFVRVRLGKRTHVVVPRVGDKRKLIAMAETNAEMLLRESIMQQAQKDVSMPKAVLDLQRDLAMTSLPRRIECYDNSHIHGTDYVSSMVVFFDGKPKKSEYRSYRLRSVEGNDDFEAMKEVMSRRFANANDDDAVLPDLVIIDGGKGQLSHAMEVLRDLGLEGRFTVVGLAKKLEEVFKPGTSDPLYLPKVSASLRLLQQARDEAHRFAITYHRKLRSKRTLRTELTDVPGIGPTTSTKLLRAFGSVKAIADADLESLASVVGPSAARKVVAHFQTSHDEAQ